MVFSNCVQISYVNLTPGYDVPVMADMAGQVLAFMLMAIVLYLCQIVRMSVVVYTD